jgi:hypothetical protein
MSYRIEQDDASERGAMGNYTYRIYDGDRLIARYWHDFRGDEHGTEFVNGPVEASPPGGPNDFIEGGGPVPLRLSDGAVAYLKSSRNRGRTSGGAI